MAARLIAQNVTKRFGALAALDGVSIEFSAGEIHAVLGENGAGKSTLMNVLSGFTKPQIGNVSLDGKPLPLGQPQQCRKLGIEMVHQHFTLVPEFSVAENLALARIDRLASRINADDLAAPAIGIARDLGWTIDPNSKVRNLPVGVQQRIEILKCLSGNAQVLIFDEPTAVLAPDEVLDLFRVLRALKEQGKIVILIAHKLSEVMAIADRGTVLRNGKKVATTAIADVDTKTLADWMVGQMPDLQIGDNMGTKAPGLLAKNVFVKGDRGENAVRGIDLYADKGEIVGVGGVDGNGQVEFAESLVLIRSIDKGQILWHDAELAAARIRIAYIPQDRQQDGLALEMSVQDNLLIQGHHRRDIRKGPFLISQKVSAWATALIQRFDIRVSSATEIAANLSGGNQQKIIVARSLDEIPDLIVAVNPTRGLDVRASRFVHDLLRNARDKGAAVVLFSTDLDELADLADTTLFMSRGELVEAKGAVSLVGGTP